MGKAVDLDFVHYKTKPGSSPKFHTIVDFMDLIRVTSLSLQKVLSEFGVNQGNICNLRHR